MNRQQARTDYDVVIVGAGPAGSCLAIHLMRLGRRPLIVEKSEFPRSRIGESLTGECGRMLREMGLTDFMTRQAFPIKRGTTVFGPDGQSKYWVPVREQDATGSFVPKTTWQVRRPEFDKKLLDLAIERGAAFELAITRDIIIQDGGVAGVIILDASGKVRQIQCPVVADASGQSTFLSNIGVCGKRRRAGYHKEIAFYAQLVGARRDPAPDDGNTQVFYKKKHHWAWFIPLSDSVTSVGVVLPKDVYKASGLRREAFFNEQIGSLNPELKRRLSCVELVSPVQVISNYSYRIDEFTGPGYLCVGDSHRCSDPIFSFGVNMGMYEARLAADAIDAYLNGGVSTQEDTFGNYREQSNNAQEIVQTIVDTFWMFPLAFLKLAHYSHKDDFAELFSGRVYSKEAQSLEAVSLMRNLLLKKGAA